MFIVFEIGSCNPKADLELAIFLPQPWSAGIKASALFMFFDLAMNSQVQHQKHKQQQQQQQKYINYTLKYYKSKDTIKKVD
jgi:hypothetical protein